jgi:hypothetical protein
MKSNARQPIEEDMNPGPIYLSLYQAATYQIRVAGRLPEDWAEQFGEMVTEVERLENGAILTSLTAPVADQAGLHGLLAHIRDLGLPLVSVVVIEV